MMSHRNFIVKPVPAAREEERGYAQRYGEYSVQRHNRAVSPRTLLFGLNARLSLI